MGIKKVNWELYLINVLAAEAVGFVGTFLSGSGYHKYVGMAKPPYMLPGAAFPVIWTIIYFLIGTAAYIISEKAADKHTNGLFLYRTGLLVNFLWPIFFFGLDFRLFALFWLFLQIYLAVKTYMRFRGLDTIAGMLMLPYVAWLVYSAYINYGYWFFNK